jgi:hypothetical protein
MFCPECGAPNEDDATFCGNCGAVLNPEEMLVEAAPDVSPLEPEKAEAVLIYDSDEEIPSAPAVERRAPQPPALPRPPVAAGPTTPSSGLAIASLLLGIGGLTILPLLGSILAIILGYMARKEIRQRPLEITGDGLALAGIVLGWIAIGLAVLGLLLGIGLTVCGLCGFMGSGPTWQ